MGDGFIIPIRVQRQTAFSPFNFNLGGFLLRDFKVIKPSGYINAIRQKDIA